MLTKIIDLGSMVSDTGEPRVRVIKDGLIKTASTEIQQFWDSMQPDTQSSFLWVIGVSAREFYGCNNNGDAFDEADLIKTHNRFVDTAHVFMQHVNKDPAKSIGKPVFSWYNDIMHRVELILRIDKNAANSAAIVAKIENGDPIFVSMGCTVDYDVCSICGNAAKTRREYCDHLRYNMRKILPDGRQVYALNPNPKFFDISIVARPADPTAFTLDKRASYGVSYGDLRAETISAELGEQSEDFSTKLAALRKISDIVKRVDGQVVDAKNNEKASIENDCHAVDLIRQNGFQHFEYPEMPYAQLERLGVSPCGLLSCLTSLGAPMTIGDAAWMCGTQAFGRPCEPGEYGKIFGLLPVAIGSLVDRPRIIDRLLSGIFGAYNGECDDPAHQEIIIRVLRPVAQARIRIVTSLANPGHLEKIGASFGMPDPDIQLGRTTRERLLNDFRSRKENFATITLRDKYGREAKTTPYFLRQAMFQNDSAQSALVKPAILAALAMGSIGAVMVQPTLLRKALAMTAMGLPAAVAAKLLKGRPTYDKGFTDSEGNCLPDYLVESTFKFEKKAMKGPGLATVAGMALPGAFALDYAWNRWRYGPEGNAQKNPIARGIAEYTIENPVTSTFAGGVAGAMLGALMRRRP